MNCINTIVGLMWILLILPSMAAASYCGAVVKDGLKQALMLSLVGDSLFLDVMNNQHVVASYQRLVGYELGSDGEIIIERDDAFFEFWAIQLPMVNNVCLYDRFMDIIECFDDEADKAYVLAKDKCKAPFLSGEYVSEKYVVTIEEGVLTISKPVYLSFDYTIGPDGNLQLASKVLGVTYDATSDTMQVRFGQDQETLISSV